MDISVEEERPAKFILSEHSVIDRAAIMDLSNVEIIYVEDDEFDESDYRESESPGSQPESHAVSLTLVELTKRKKYDVFVTSFQKKNQVSKL